jgi:hypothetical protein
MYEVHPGSLEQSQFSSRAKTFKAADAVEPDVHVETLNGGRQDIQRSGEGQRLTGRRRSLWTGDEEIGDQMGELRVGYRPRGGRKVD